MVHMSYLRQNLEVSRDFRDVPRKKQKIINLEVSLNGLSRSSVIKAPNLKVVFVWTHTIRVASEY